MMTVKKGNLLDAAVAGEVDLVMHGCNCFHAMCSGIAGQIAQRFPLAVAADKDTHRGDPAKLGKYTLARVFSSNPHREFDIINLYTQFRPGKDFIPSIFPTAIAGINKDFKGKTIGIPLIGCGIGGGSWEEVQNALLTQGRDVDWRVYVL